MSIYFLYTDFKIGLLFLLGNLMIFGYFLLNKDSIATTNKTYEGSLLDTESYLQEILNNFDKIIYLGQTEKEMDMFTTKTADTIKTSYDFYSNTTKHTLIMYGLVNAIIIGIIYILIMLRFDNKVSVVKVITLITILNIYRDNMDAVITTMADTLEINGRMDVLLETLNIDADINDIDEADINGQLPVDEELDQLGEITSIVFENVSHRYSDDGPYVLKDFNVEIRPTGGKIIGIRGDAGGGKSTMMKLLLKLNTPTKGRILINGKEIGEISEKELRRKITYVDQKGKMFDRTMEENVLYGCENEKRCNEEMDRVKSGSRERVKEVIKKEGSVGEKWSGGERQVSNVLSGLIKGGGILILDEPTNGVDGELKEEIKQLLREKAKEKDCIIIITHDEDVVDLMDETIMIR